MSNKENVLPSLQRQFEEGKRITTTLGGVICHAEYDPGCASCSIKIPLAQSALKRRQMVVSAKAPGTRVDVATASKPVEISRRQRSRTPIEAHISLNTVTEEVPCLAHGYWQIPTADSLLYSTTLNFPTAEHYDAYCPLSSQTTLLRTVTDSDLTVKLLLEEDTEVLYFSTLVTIPHIFLTPPKESESGHTDCDNGTPVQDEYLGNALVVPDIDHSRHVEYINVRGQNDEDPFSDQYELISTVDSYYFEYDNDDLSSSGDVTDSEFESIPSGDYCAPRAATPTAQLSQAANNWDETDSDDDGPPDFDSFFKDSTYSRLAATIRPLYY
ncbi:hypothetical protein CVT25_011784 [Psilocybe cyanescens]|uniref:Uncharacterized protein n=1 Tax=Psilocybe cyanescens TaxID=93625 RepID=A0A409WJ73_PSICY|nr:hypothetical protein CVT25_011784 [Psilocybe cyanescens]